MDRSWIQLDDRNSIEYETGVKEFISFAKCNVEPGKDTISCPCIRCNNGYEFGFDEVEDHIIIFGMVKGYTIWVSHGESYESSSEGEDEGFEYDSISDGEDEDLTDVMEMLDDMHKGSDKNFTRMMEQAVVELYPGCKTFSRLSFTVHLLHLKLKNHWSNDSFTDLLSMLRKALPDGNSLPKSYYEAKKIIRDLGLSYEKIHVCKNNCVLFWKENKDADVCPNCKTQRYRDKVGVKKVPHKVLRYFPLKPRLQRLFISKVTAKDMRWHMDEREKDGVLRHPADSEVWKSFDEKHHVFAADSRNVRLGLSSDGFDPFSSDNSHSIWPVFLVPYNLPPWSCMKEQFLFMSLLIPGPKAPGIDIDVFLQPLIDDLQELWYDGIETYDAYDGSRFQLRGAILWTISDLPAYGDLSGWSTKGKLACPSCNEDASHKYLKNWGATCYIGHRRFLPQNHRFRKDKEFDGKNEYRFPPRHFSGDDVLEQLKMVEQPKFGKVGENGKKRKRSSKVLNWTKKSIFFKLPYWKNLKLRHNLDVMHIEKNICDNILGTLMNIERKTKDSYKARLDLKEMGIREHLHPVVTDGIIDLPDASYVFSPSEKKDFLEYLNSVKFPDAYASNTTQFVNLDDCRITGLKSHDCHIMLQQLLPVGLRAYLSKDVHSPLIQLGLFFRALTSKSLNPDALDRLDKEIVLILCKLEKVLPPSFFTIMMHLPIYLAHEARLAGPVQFRWMYFFERYMHKLKGYVRNAARPEGSIAEGYIDNECLMFCSMYFDGVETKFNPSERNADGFDRQKREILSIFRQKARNLGGRVYAELSLSEFKKVKWYVLNNWEDVLQYQELYKKELERESNTENQQQPAFHEWFLSYVSKLHKEKSSTNTKQLLSLARGPDRRVTHYTGCVINGLRFRTKERESQLRTQNSGIVVDGYHKGEKFEYYGVLRDIIELSFLDDYKVLLFKCDWYNIGNRNGMRKDEHNFVSVNVTKTWYKEDPFILASQARQVFYMDDKKLGRNWRVVQKCQPRWIYNIPKIDSASDQGDVYQEPKMQELDHSLDIDGGMNELHGDAEEELLENELHGETETISGEFCETDEEITSESTEEDNDLMDDDSADDN